MFERTVEALLSHRPMMLAVAGALLGSCLVASSAHGLELKEVEGRLTRTYRECPGFKNAIDPEMLACISAEFEVQDKRLNAAYRRAMAALAPDQQAALRTAQKTWLSYRDQWCGVIDVGASGSLDRIAASECRLKETVLQTIKLEDVAKYGEAGA